jgi:alginate O-acetyltransferase complex protein AlgI
MALFTESLLQNGAPHQRISWQQAALVLFHSQAFLLGFLPITLGLYYWVAQDLKKRQYLLIAASLIFYGWWDIRFVPLLLGQVVLTWGLVGIHFRTGARWPLRFGICANLTVLGLFKYVDFLFGVLEQAFSLSFPRAALILPIGISFYTFQVVSYLVDVLRGDAPYYELRRLTLFVVLFPHLIAGPIVRHNEIIPQFASDPLRPGAAERVCRGLALLVIGIAGKVLVADNLAGIADQVFAAVEHDVPTFSDSAAGTLAFALQVFFDFAAYSDMAIGLALMLGFHFPLNFDQPYRSTSLRLFWRRWHMTLSRFLRDYVYIPLGGSRQGAACYVFAALVTMGLCGLWHGAGWTFVLWGLGHGIGLVVSKSWADARLPMPPLLGWLLTFLFAVLLFGLFRATDLASAWRLWAGLVGAGGAGQMWSVSTSAPLLVGCVLALQPLTPRDALNRWLIPTRAWATALAGIAFYAVLLVGVGQPKSFIYFQF